MQSLYNPISSLEIARKVVTGELEPETALLQHLDKASLHEDQLHIFAHMNQAPIPAVGPLQGIAVGVKDIFDTFDMPTRYNSEIYQQHQPVADASLVAMLKEAGATIVGKTVTTEYAFFEPGPTRNPHNLDHTPGGSSSGSAAGVAAGYFPAALGTQTGGSVIRPASFCGVGGYKPSFRLFPTVGLKCFSWSLDTVGFFGKGIADCAFIAAACSGRDLTVDQSNNDIPRIGILSQSVDAHKHPEMNEAFNRTLSAIERSGASTVDLSLPDEIEAGHDAHGTIQNYECVRSLAHERLTQNSLLSPMLQRHLESSKSITSQAYDNARRTANKARKNVHHLFNNCDVLLTPAALGPAPKGLASTGDPAMNRLWSLLGLPTVNVAGQMSRDGLPLGMQIIAPFGKDKLALQVGHWLETQIKSA